MSVFGTLEAQIVTDVAADVTNSTILVNNVLAQAIRMLEGVAQRKVDDTTVYAEVKRITNTPNATRAAACPHDWLK